MTNRQASVASTARRALPFGVLIVAAALCFFSAGDRLANLPGHAPSRLSPSWFGTGNAHQAALRALDRRDFGAALNWSKRVVARDPVGEYSSGLLGVSLLGIGQPAAAQRAYTVAASTGWRDEGVQTYWLMAALTLGDNTIAAERLDALLRVGNRDDQTLVGLSELESSPEGRAALAARLAGNPDWGLWYIASVAKLSGEAQAKRNAVLVAASRQGFTPLPVAVSTAVLTLLSKSAFLSASTLYRAFGGTGPAGRAVANPGFESPLGRFSSMPFAWRLFETGSLDVRRQAVPTGTGYALYISSTGSETQNVAQQTLLLLPGRYQLSWYAVDDQGHATDDIDVRLFCMPSKRAVFSPEDIAADHRGQHMATFSIPGSACAGQSLLVVAEPQGPASQAADWLDNVELRHVAG